MRKFIDHTAYNIAYLLICIVFISCNTFNNIPGVYLKFDELAQMHKILFMYPDSTYMAHYYFHAMKETCDSGIWTVRNDKKSIELQSTLPDAKSIPIDVIEELTNEETTAIITSRPYKDTFINTNGNNASMMEWKLVIDGEDFVIDKDTLLLDRRTINSLSLESYLAEELHDRLWPELINKGIKTKTYHVKNIQCNKFTIILPTYVGEKKGFGKIDLNIFHALPMNKTIDWEELKKFKVNRKRLLFRGRNFPTTDKNRAC